MTTIINSITQLIESTEPLLKVSGNNYIAGLKILSKVFGDDFIDFPAINFDTERFIDNGRTVTLPYYHSTQLMSINGKIDLLVVCDTGGRSVDCPFRISSYIDRESGNFDIRIHDQVIARSYSIISKEDDDYFTDLEVQVGTSFKLSQLLNKVESLR